MMKNVKRILAMFCIMAMMISCLPLTTKAESTKTGKTGDCTWTLSGTTLTISGTGKMGDLSLDDDWMVELPWGKTITKVVIKSGVTSIGDCAFCYCENLTSVSIPSTVKSIGALAFAGTGLKTFTIPESVTQMGERAFGWCDALESVTISKSIKTIPNYAFWNAENLKSVKIPNGVTCIEECAFAGCGKLNYVELPSSVTKIGEFAFGNDTEDLTIYGISGSYAQTYAKANNINFVVTGTTIWESELTAKLSASTYTYNGNVKTPTVTVTNANGKKLTKGTDYTVSYAKGRKNVGKYSVKITFKGNYSGTKTLTFTIKPRQTTLKSVARGSKRMTVKWSKKTTQTTGYQIQYSTSSSFKNAKTVTITSNKTTAKTIKNLKAKKKYYVRIRTYKKVGTTKYYSSWSRKKAVTTKK